MLSCASHDFRLKHDQCQSSGQPVQGQQGYATTAPYYRKLLWDQPEFDLFIDSLIFFGERYTVWLSSGYSLVHLFWSDFCVRPRRTVLSSLSLPGIYLLLYWSMHSFVYMACNSEHINMKPMLLKYSTQNSSPFTKRSAAYLATNFCS